MSGRESLVIALALTCSVSLMGWIVWSERPSPVPSPEVPTANLEADVGERAAEAPLDETHVAALEAAAADAPDDIGSRLALGDVYARARRFEQALPWYEAAVEIDPTNQRALLSLGIVRAFGLQDIEGATALWERVVEIGPDSPEGRAASDSLDRMSAGHTAVEGDGSNVP